MIYYKYSQNSNNKIFNIDEFFESCSDSKYLSQNISDISNMESNQKKDEEHIKKLKKTQIHSKLSTPIIKNKKINGITFNKNQAIKLRSNNYLPLTESRFKSNEINFKPKNSLLHNSNNSFNPNVSNGETNEIHNNYKKNNYDLIRKKLLLISKKEKKNSIKDKNKNGTKSQTSKDIQDIVNFNEVKIKEYKKKINKNFRRRENKSMTIFQLDPEYLSKLQNHNNTFKFLKSRQEWDKKHKLKYNKTEKNEKTEEPTIFTYKDKRSSSFTTKKLKERKNNIIHHRNTNTINIQFKLPNLGFNKPFPTERKSEINNFNQNNRFLNNSVKERQKSNSINKQIIQMKSLRIINNLKKINVKSLDNKNLFRKQTFNMTKNKTDMISNKILKSHKSYINKKNKFLKKLKDTLKDEHPNDLLDDWKISKKSEEISTNLKYIKSKIKDWVSGAQSSNLENDQKIIFNGEENKYNEKKEKKYLKRIVRDYIKRINTPEDITTFYFKYHKGIIEENILVHLQKEFFDLSLPSYLFEYKCNRLYLSKIPKKKLKKVLLRQNTLNDKKNILPNNQSNQSNLNISNTAKKPRRFSCLNQLRKKSLPDFVVPLNDFQKKYTLFLFYLDMDLDNMNNSDNDDIENEEKNSFLELLRGNLNNVETQDLLINKFITNYIKKTGAKNKALSYNKKNSIKNNNNISKSRNDSLKSNKIPLFKNNFFSRREIQRSSYKLEHIKKKKSLLEYNLLFDPNLTGYNNLITDIVFEPKTERTIINKGKKKELRDLKNKQLTSFFISSGGMKTDKNIIVMKTLDLKNQYNYKNKGNINSLTSSIKDCNYDSFIKYYRACNCGPNAIDKDGNSLLSLSVKSSCIEIVNFLLNEKANPNLQNVRQLLYNKNFLYYRCLEIHLCMKL